MPKKNDLARRQEVDAAVTEYVVDRRRFYRFTEGETIEQIALADQLTPEEARRSITRGRKMIEGEKLLILRDRKVDSLLEAEEIRKKVRRKVGAMIAEKVEKLLTGKRTIVSIDKKTGEILTQDIDDPEVISNGLEHARKIMDLDVRPAQNQTIVNVQHNQQTINEGAAPALSYEDRLRKIKGAQKELVSSTSSERIYDVEPILPVRQESAETAEVSEGTTVEWSEF